MANIFLKIWLLTWKNLTLRKRHFVLTAFEIILPTLLAFIITFAIPRKNLIGGGVGDGENRTNVKEKINIVFEEQALLGKASQVVSSIYPINKIAYAPNNSITQQIMKNVLSYMANNKIDVLGFTDEKTIVHYVEEQEATTIGLIDGIVKIAVVFESGVETGSIGHSISYRIRLISTWADYGWEFPSTREIFPLDQSSGPQEYNIERYINVGFIGLQIAIDKSIIQIITSQNITQKINIQAYPYPEYTNVDTIFLPYLYDFIIPVLLTHGFIFVVPSIIRNVISEKETGIKEFMKMMGVPNWCNWFGWMIHSLSVSLISITIITFLFFGNLTSEGPIYTHSNGFLYWIILVLYAMAITSFCCCISTFFQKASIGTTVGILMFLLTYHLPYWPLSIKFSIVPLHLKLLSALLPNVALHWILKCFGVFEAGSTGSTFSNLFEGISPIDELSVGLLCIMLIVDIILYMSLAIYFENIIPSEYGITKPFYYIFQPSTYGCKLRKGTTARVGPSESSPDTPGFEAEPTDLKAGVVVNKLGKAFGRNKIAVDGISFKCYEGQITALLGHNGAGKTTTMSILTGIIAPSSGTALVNGYDINTEMDKVRMNIGLCPQQNMIFNDLTVKEHLIFFGRLKGLSSEKAKARTNLLLMKLQLTEKQNALAGSISGGQKRKLSLGMALIGEPPVIILDEPSSGMDVEARRAVWDVLLEMRRNRTIILTTHFMEEADVLGNRIAIMAEGKLKCSGSPMFLKKFYGAGYTLRLTFANLSVNKSVLELVQKHLPNASLQESQSASEREVGITIPNESNTNSVFPALFSDLSRKKEEFGIQTIGLSLTTMDEIFIKVGEKENEQQLKRNSRSLSISKKSKSQFPQSESQSRKSISYSKKNWTKSKETGLKDPVSMESRIGDSEAKVKGISLYMQQFYGLLWKKMLYTFRKRMLFISQFFIPILMVSATIWLTNETRPPIHPALTMKLSTYKNPITLFTSTDSGLSSIYESVVGSSAKESTTNDINEALLEVGRDNLRTYRRRYIVAGELNDTSYTALFSSIPYHAAPLSVNLMSNTILRNMAKDYSIEVSSHPIKTTFAMVLEADLGERWIKSVEFGVLFPIGLALFAASFIIFPLEEKLSKAKQLQLMAGANPLVYWFSMFIFDFFVMLALISVMLIPFPVFESYIKAYTSYHGLGVIFLLLVVYGFSAISFSYLLSLSSKTVSGGFSLVVTIHILTGIILPMIYIVVRRFKKKVGIFYWFIFYIGSIFPTFGASLAMMVFVHISTFNIQCNKLTEDHKAILCNPESATTSHYRVCCPNCQELVGECFTPQRYIKWLYVLRGFGPPEYVFGISRYLYYMFFMGIVYNIFILIFEYGIISKAIGSLYKTKKELFQNQTNDEDVLNENSRVEELVSDRRCNEDALLVHILCKNYGSFAAVSNLSFGVHHGECFGLLGVNGAGKTTTFRMLTGDEIRSNGNAFAFGYTLDKNRNDFTSLIGYCPQFDAFVSVLTGKEMLDLFGRLRGIQPGNIKTETQKWLTQLGLSDSGNVQCGKYSGGMKRRLSAGMAMIGDPPIILLDEPSAGVDPIARREFWKIMTLVRDAGQSCVLTSHSMDECEALCSRLGIMVNGSLQCLGGAQHIKHKFGQGYSLVIKLRGQNSESEVRKLMEQINKIFSPCVLKDEHQNILQYQVLNTEMNWGDIFTAMENIKKSNETLIEEYSISETSLEDVFLSFARLQYTMRETNNLYAEGWSLALAEF